MRVKKLILTLVILLIPFSVWAHHSLPIANFGFKAGLLHPLTGFDHLLTMLFVGILSYQQYREKVWLLPSIFVLCMVLGSMIGIIGYQIPYIELIIAFSVLGCALCIAIKTKLPKLFLIAMVGLFAVFHGFAHGMEIMPGSSILQYVIGFIITTGCLHFIGIFFAKIALLWRVKRV